MLITDAAVRETAATIAQSLGEGWVIDPEAPADGAAPPASYTHPRPHEPVATPEAVLPLEKKKHKHDTERRLTDIVHVL
ncbi:hypothetical protein, partial [Streptomyces ipomoeae]|uniref:hypothetical protein n=1 Tax=Streptomyces ipomoeae TaxID=103232 RepID=UPI0029A488E5